ncbi:MAG: DinB family protein [bacterium]|nr:DinB family protein [bacterium]
MHQTLSAVADLYKLNTNIFEKILEGFENARQFERSGENANSVNWIAGHMASSRFGVAAALGLEEKCPWGDLYDMGAEVSDTSKYPSLDEIKAVWKDLSGKIVKGMEEVSEDQLAGKPAWEPPAVEHSNRGIVAFMSFHESYHMGQLGYLRKIHGLDSAFG